MDERRLRVGSLFEWIAAGLGVAGLIWVLSVPLQRLSGPRVDAALFDLRARTPPGVPAGATSVPVLLLLDGRAVRIGDLETRLHELLPDSQADGRPHVSAGDFGDRTTRGYRIHGAHVYVVCEPTERGGPSRITGIFVP